MPEILYEKLHPVSCDFQTICKRFSRTGSISRMTCFTKHTPKIISSYLRTRIVQNFSLLFEMFFNYNDRHKLLTATDNCELERTLRRRREIKKKNSPATVSYRDEQ